MPRRNGSVERWVARRSSALAEWGTITLLFLAPLWFIPLSFSRSSAKLSIILAGIIVVLGATALKAWARREIVLRVPWIFVGVSLFVIASALSLIGAKNLCFAMSSLLLLCLFLGFGLTVAQLGNTKLNVQRILCALLAASSLAALIAILQYIGYLGDPLLSPIERAISTFGNRNYFGSFVGVVAIPSLALLLNLRKRRLWMVAWVAIAMLFLGPLLVQQTGMFIALLAGIVFVGLGVAVFGIGRYIRTHYKTIFVVFLAAVLGLGVGLTLWSVNPYWETSSGDGLWSANSGYTRELDWWTAWEMFKTNPLTGVGLGNFKVEFLDYKAQFLATSRGAQYGFADFRAAQAHNEFLQMAAELGVPGIVAILGLVLVAVATSWRRCLCIPEPKKRLEFLLISAGLVVAAIHAVVSFPLHLPITALALVTLLGLISSSYFGERTIIHARVGGTKARVTALAGILTVCLLGLVLGRELMGYASFSQGKAQMAVGENEQALQLLTKSVAISCCSTEAKFQLATVALLLSDQSRQLGEQEKASSLLQIAWASALESQDEYPTSQGLLFLAGIAVMRDEDTLAEDILLRLLVANPISEFKQGARYLLAALEAREGDLVSAKVSLRTLIDEYPAYIQSYVLLGQLFLQEGMREDGLQVFEQGMQMVESELLRIETELKTASRAEREELAFDQQRLLLERQSLSTLVDNL